MVVVVDSSMTVEDVEETSAASSEVVGVEVVEVATVDSDTSDIPASVVGVVEPWHAAIESAAPISSQAWW